MISNHLKIYPYLIDTSSMVEDPIPKKPSELLGWLGILVIIVGFFVYVSSISWTGWFVPIVPKWADYMCYSSLFLGTGLMILYLALEHRYEIAIEAHNGKKQWKLWHLFLFFLAIDLVIRIFSTIL